MSRKQDPIYAVIDFFEREPLAVARSTFSLVQRIVKKRTAAEEPPPVKKTTKKRVSKPAVDPLDSAPVAPPTPQPHLPPTVEATKARRRKATANTLSTPAARQESDLALPGLGPTTVGD